MYISTLLKAIVCALVIGSSCNAHKHPHHDVSVQIPSTRHCSYHNNSSSCNDDGEHYNDDDHTCDCDSSRDYYRFNQDPQSYSNITTKNGVIAFIEQVLENSIEGVSTTIFIEQLTGKNDLKDYSNEALQALLSKTRQAKADQITLHDVSLHFTDRAITIMFKIDKKDANAVKVEYNLNDDAIHSFKDGFSALQTISTNEFEKACSSLKDLKEDTKEKATSLKDDAVESFNNVKDKSKNKIQRSWRWLKGKVNRLFNRGK